MRETWRGAHDWSGASSGPLYALVQIAPNSMAGLANEETLNPRSLRNMRKRLSMAIEPTRLKRTELAEVLVRIVAGGLTVGLLIVLPAIKIVEAALS